MNQPTHPTPDARAAANRLALDNAQLLVIDVQVKLTPLIHEQESVVAQVVRMVRAAAEMRLPVTLSEQYVRGLGPTVEAVSAAAADAPRLEKATFSCCGDEGLLHRLEALARPQVLLCGIETHVCVLQTALDLLARGRQPWLLVDAAGSRRPADRDAAIERMRAAGVVVTTVESAAFELMGRCDTELFKRMLPIVK